MTMVINGSNAATANRWLSELTSDAIWPGQVFALQTLLDAHCQASRSMKTSTTTVTTEAVNVAPNIRISAAVLFWPRLFNGPSSANGGSIQCAALRIVNGSARIHKARVHPPEVRPPQ
jgi:hypothetical protein